MVVFFILHALFIPHDNSSINHYLNSCMRHYFGMQRYINATSVNKI